MRDTFKVISLFSGCGGLDLGFLGGFELFNSYYTKHPFEIIWANDIFKQACETYRYNIGNHMVEKDISIIENEEIPSDADVVIGGFPCQDFSISGKRRGTTVKRGRLYLELKRVIEHVQPKIFLAENVEGLLTMEDGLILETILNDFRSMDAGNGKKYHVQYQLLNAADYNVPQTRKRVFIVGIRSDMLTDFKYPLPTTFGKWMTVEEAIDDLWGKEYEDIYFNHNQCSGAKFHVGKKMQGNYKLKKDRPSITIRAEHHGNIEGHYRSLNEQDPDNPAYWRRITVRECARIQTFPDNFKFLGATSYTYKQVGNAVPPILGWHMANAIKDVLVSNK